MSGAQAPRHELIRDRPETAFSRILGTFLRSHGGVRAAVFLDLEGECVDYATSVDPYDAMVLSATLLNPTKTLIERCAATPRGNLVQWILEADRMDAVIRRVSEDLFLTLWLEAGALTARLLIGIDPLVDLLRRESGLVPAGTDGGDLQVETRPAKGWGYAPRSVRGASVPSTDVEVLGRWTEPGTFVGQEAVCFRVRTADLGVGRTRGPGVEAGGPAREQDREWTLVHDPGLRRWYRR